MAFQNLAMIGEVEVNIDVVGDDIVAVQIVNLRDMPPVFIVYRPNGAVRATIRPLAGQSITVAVNPPIALSRIIADSTIHGGTIVGQELLVWPVAWEFIERG